MKTEGRKRRKATKKSDYHGLANHRMHQNTAVRTSDSGKDSNDEATQDIDGQLPIGKAGPYFSSRRLESHIRAAHPKAPTTMTAKYTFSI